MHALLEKEQLISIVPQNFKNSNKGNVKEIYDDKFLVEVQHSPDGILLNNLIEFYSQTPNGVLYFESDVVNIEGNTLTVLSPIKHRFLQRRQFSRVKFNQDLDFYFGDKSYKVKVIDLSSGGLKIQTREHLDIEKEYDFCLELLSEQTIKSKVEPIRIEKGDDGIYTLSGRFKELSNIDKMTLIQFCLKKNTENNNR